MQPGKERWLPSQNIFQQESRRREHTLVRFPITLLRMGYKVIPHALPQMGQHDLGDSRTEATNHCIPSRLSYSRSPRRLPQSGLRLGSFRLGGLQCSSTPSDFELEARSRGKEGRLGSLFDFVVKEAARGEREEAVSSYPWSPKHRTGRHVSVNS